jgi:AraC-like DNA-binding protein
MKKKDIPGYRKADIPGDLDSKRIRFSPFIRQSGIEWRGRWFLKERKLLDYLIVYITGGKGYFSVRGNPFPVEDNDLVWIPPDTLHEMKGISERMHLLYMHFDLLYDPHRSSWDATLPGGLKDMQRFKAVMHPEIDDPVIGSLNGKLDVNNKARIRLLMERIIARHKESPRTSALLLSGLMLELIYEILEGLSGKDISSGNNFERIRAAAVSIRRNPEEKPDIGKLAKDTGLSISHFRRLFREANGQSIFSFYNDVRFSRAFELLVYSNKSITEIAETMGFSNIHNFTRAFQKYSGTTPSGFRRGKLEA